MGSERAGVGMANVHPNLVLVGSIKRPVTRFMFNAINTGDFDGLEDIAADELKAFADGYPLLMEEAEQGRNRRLIAGHRSLHDRARSVTRWSCS